MKNLQMFTALVVGVLILGVVVACGGAAQPAAPVSAPEQAAATELLAPDAYAISLEPIGHWHVLAPKTLVFSVQDTAGDAGLAGADLFVQIARTDSDRVTERSVSAEQVRDEGKGIYSLEYTPASIGAYALTATFVKDGQHFASVPVIFEVARDGEEGIKVEAEGTSYVYQIRYNWEPGHIHANDTEPAKLVFEIMRGVQTGAEINWDQPWQNTFNHITNVENAVVRIESADGSVSEELPVTYKGKGIYEAERVFPVAEVGEELDYEVFFSFTDAVNGAQVTHAEPYPLHADESH